MIGKRVLLLACLLAGCAARGPSYAQQVYSIPPPADDADRSRKCSWLRSEMARQQNIAQIAAMQMQPMYAAIAQSNARNNIATLESRASDFGCYAAFSARQPQPGIQACIDACKTNTDRTPAQCFDSCNH